MWRSDVNLNVETLEGDVANILASQESKSGKMKKMFDIGLSVKEISDVMNVRYNFVYNVISNYININDIPTEKDQADSKKDQIIALFLAGKMNREISKELKLNYNYIYKVVREYAEKNTEALRPATAVASATPAPTVQRPAPQVTAPAPQTITVDPRGNLKEQIAAITHKVAVPETKDEVLEEPLSELVDEEPAEYEEVSEQELIAQAVNESPAPAPQVEQKPPFEERWKSIKANHANTPAKPGFGFLGRRR